MTSQAQKQEFIGGLIASVLVKEGGKVIGQAVKKGLQKVADRPDNQVTEADAKKAAPVVTNEVEKEVKAEAQAQAEHKLDAEPHWQSRNLWGSFVGIITAAETLRIFWTDGQAQTAQEYLVPIGILVAALTPLYSRFVAKKPLFR
jgi:hypothetical protein